MEKTNPVETSPEKLKKRTRTVTPRTAILRLADSLPPNDDHPLARLHPHQRGEKRCGLMASILARLASTHTKTKRMCFPVRTKK